MTARTASSDFVMAVDVASALAEHVLKFSAISLSLEFDRMKEGGLLCSKLELDVLLTAVLRGVGGNLLIPVPVYADLHQSCRSACVTMPSRCRATPQ